MPGDRSVHPARGPRRSFLVSAAVVFMAGIGIGGFVFNAHYFDRAMGLSTLVGGLAAGVGGQIETPWSRSQRMLMLITAGALGVSLGLLVRFVF